jgi:hypothetical protein
MYKRITKEITIAGIAREVRNDGIIPSFAYPAPTRNELPSTVSPTLTQLDTSMASPGVTGISNGVVKPDTDVDDGTDIPIVAVSLVVSPGATFPRKI